jgi:hypothetical protein
MNVNQFHGQLPYNFNTPVHTPVSYALTAGQNCTFHCQRITQEYERVKENETFIRLLLDRLCKFNSREQFNGWAISSYQTLLSKVFDEFSQKRQTSSHKIIFQFENFLCTLI